MKLIEMAYIVREYIIKLDTTPYILAYSIANPEKPYKIFIENPQITKEEYLDKMGLTEE